AAVQPLCEHVAAARHRGGQVQHRHRHAHGPGTGRLNGRSKMNRPFAGLLLVILFVSAATVSAEVIWRGGFETGDTSQWKRAPKDGVPVVKDPGREGKYALGIDGTNGAKKGKHDRIEFQHQPKPPGTAEGTERYFGWSVYLPKKLIDSNHS